MREFADDAPVELVPGPILGTVRNRGLDEGASIGVAPPVCRKLGVENFDRPPILCHVGLERTLGAASGK